MRSFDSTLHLLKLNCSYILVSVWQFVMILVDSMVLTLASYFISPHDPVRQRSNAWGKSSCINACNLQHQSLLWNATQLSPASPAKKRCEYVQKRIAKQAKLQNIIHLAHFGSIRRIADKSDIRDATLNKVSCLHVHAGIVEHSEIESTRIIKNVHSILQELWMSTNTSIHFFVSDYHICIYLLFPFSPIFSTARGVYQIGTLAFQCRWSNSLAKAASPQPRSTTSADLRRRCYQTPRMPWNHVKMI